jgi:hypothetical protein
MTATPPPHVFGGGISADLMTASFAATKWRGACRRRSFECSSLQAGGVSIGDTQFILLPAELSHTTGKCSLARSAPSTLPATYGRRRWNGAV